MSLGRFNTYRGLSGSTQIRHTDALKTDSEKI